MNAANARHVSFFRILLVRLRFLFAFLVIGLVVANWDRITHYVDRWTARAVHEEGGGESEWFCPMHPSVVMPAPDKCPICGMPLSKRRKGEKTELPGGILSRMQLSPYRIRQAGLATDAVAYRPLVRELRAVGTVAFDERRLTDVSARVAGRADELFGSFTGGRVKAGDPLYKVYSPDLASTEEELVLALKALDEIRSRPQHEDVAIERAQNLAAATRERLRRWGIDDAELKRLEETRKPETHLVISSPVSGVVWKKDVHAGHWIEAGSDPYTIADDSRVWVEVEVFEQEIGLVKEGLEASITSEAYSGEPFLGVVAYVLPALESRTRTVKARVDVDNTSGKLKPGMFVSTVIKLPLGGKPPAEAPPRESKTYFVCEMHKDFALAQPGTCDRCGGMALEPLKTASGSMLVFACPDHPDQVSDKPGKCKLDGKALEWKVVPAPDDGAGNVLSVPISAVVDTGFRKSVFVEKERGVFDAVEVGLGPRAGEYYQVLRGLAPGDRVVTAGAFLLDAEARLNPSAGVAYFGASGHEAHK